MKQLKVSDQVHEQLSRIKEEEGHTSFDSVIRGMIYEYKRE